MMFRAPTAADSSKVATWTSDLNIRTIRYLPRDMKDSLHLRSQPPIWPRRPSNRAPIGEVRLSKLRVRGHSTRQTWSYCRRRPRSWGAMHSLEYRKLWRTTKKKHRSYSIGASRVFKRWCKLCQCRKRRVWPAKSRITFKAARMALKNTCWMRCVVALIATWRWSRAKMLSITRWTGSAQRSSIKP